MTIPLLANWQWANLFSPIHIIFLELVMALGWCGLAALIGVGWIEVYKVTNATKKLL